MAGNYKKPDLDFEMYSVMKTIEDMFYDNEEHREERKGLHASSIIKSQNEFCLREQVLSTLFKQDKSKRVGIKLKKIFDAGDWIHEALQKMFEAGGIAIGIEKRVYSREFDLYLTPDAVVMINGRKYIIEIKSANTRSYESMITGHPSGNNQLQLYMHLLAIPHGIVLIYDKNDHEMYPFKVEYEFGQARPFIERLYAVKEGRRMYELQGTLPPRVCLLEGCKRAERCNMTGACFGTRKVFLK